MTTGNSKLIKVYYNSACPVCNAGISSQKEKMMGCNIQWTDVHTEADVYREISSDLEFVRERLHAVDERGEIKVGIEAFEVIWRNSPGERWKAGIISLPVIKQICSVLYNLFARLLYKWNRWKHHW